MSELRAAAERVRLDGGPRQRWGATAGGLAIVIGLSILDASWSKDFPTAVVIGPFFTALAASERQTAAVAIAAVASVLLSATWNDTGLEAAYWLRATVVATGGALAVVAAHRRTRATQAEAIGAQLTAALSNLAEAVVVQDDNNRLLYANDAAARTLGYASAEVLLTTPREQLVGEADYFNEDGSPLSDREYPTSRVLRGENPGPVTIRIVKRPTGEERWRVTKARGVNDSRGRPRLVVSVIEDITDRKRSELAQRLLSRTGDVLASSLDYEQTLREVASLAVPELADWCGVSMPDRQGFIRQVAVAHSDPSKVEFVRDFGAPLPVARERCDRLRAGPPRRAGPADPRDPRRAARAGRGGPRAARADPQPGHALGGDGAVGLGDRPADRRDLVRQRRVRPRVHRNRPRPVRGDRAARRHCDRERPSLRGALHDRAHPAACAATAGAARHPRVRPRHALPAGGARELGRRRLLRRVRRARRLDGGGRRRRRARRAGRLADRLQPPRDCAPRRSCTTTRSTR